MISLKVALLLCVLMMNSVTGQSGVTGTNQTARLITKSQGLITPTAQSSGTVREGNWTASSEHEGTTDPSSNYTLMLVFEVRNLVDNLQNLNVTEEEFVTTYQKVLNLTFEIDSYFGDDLSNDTALMYSEISADFFNITRKECPDYQKVKENIEKCPNTTQSIEIAYEQGDLTFCRSWQRRHGCLTKATDALKCSSRLSATLTNRNSQMANISALCSRRCSDLMGLSRRCIELESDIRDHQKNVTYMRHKCDSALASGCLNISVTEPCSLLWSYIQSKHPGFVREILDVCIPKAAKEESVTGQLLTHTRSVAIITNITYWSENVTWVKANQSIAVEPTRGLSSETTTSSVEIPTPTNELTRSTTNTAPSTTTTNLETPGPKVPWQRPYNWIPCAEDEKATGLGVACGGWSVWCLLMEWVFLHVVMTTLI
ncbi:uncharacterized protein LOC135476652 [Liolophura sinensis]|uniref:uncharacterized protein LOC135476652 n=1 Tax=Liolophura sinensis TaxID=3198878 RepID=UPI00315919B3